MTGAVVVDASVVIKWVVPEAGTIDALALLERFSPCAPDLVIAECANILWKKVTRGELETGEADAAARLLEASALETRGTRHLLGRSTTLAVSLGHPAYDCLYLALAQELDLPFVTADERLVRKLADTSPSDPPVRVLALTGARDALAELDVVERGGDA